MADEKQVRVSVVDPKGKRFSLPEDQLGAFFRSHSDWDLAPTTDPATAGSTMAQNLGIPPLTSHGAAIEYALGGIGEGAKKFAQGTAATFDPHINKGENIFTANPAVRTVKGLGQLGSQALQVPGAIKDILSSPGPMYEKILTALSGVVPETAGGVAAAAAGEGAVKLAEKTPAAIRIGSQELSGAGKEPVYLAELERAKQIKAKMEAHARVKEAVTRQNSDALLKHEAETREAQQSYMNEAKEAADKYQAKLKEFNEAEASKKSQHAEAVKQARQEWVEKAKAAKDAQRQHDAVKAQRETLSKSRDVITKRLMDNVKEVHAKVRGGLNQRWEQMREAVGARAVRTAPIYSAIKASRDMLAGVPADLKIFNDIVKTISDEGGEVELEGGGTEPKIKPDMPWQDARTQFSAIGEKAFAADGVLRRALRNVYDAYDAQLGKTANEAGVGKEYSGLKKDWSQYMHDWHDLSAASSGGSTLARVYRAPAGFIPQLVLGKGEFLKEFGHYRNAGASTALGEGLRKINQQAKSLPTVRVPKAPGKFVEPEAPKAGTAPEVPKAKEPKLPTPPKLRTAKEPTLPGEIDPVEFRKRILTQKAGLPPGLKDFIPGYQINHLLLKSKAFRDWVASQPRNEIKPYE